MALVSSPGTVFVMKAGAVSSAIKILTFVPTISLVVMVALVSTQAKEATPAPALLDLLEQNAK